MDDVLMDDVLMDDVLMDDVLMDDVLMDARTQNVISCGKISSARCFVNNTWICDFKQVVCSNHKNKLQSNHTRINVSES
jgi:hypothetical protein